MCERGRLTRTEDDGRITILAESYGGKGLHWPNDVTTSTAGAPDGVKADALGNLSVCEAEEVIVFDSEASLIVTIRLPEAPSNCVFSKDRSVLFVTAKTSVYEVDIANLLG